MKKRFPYLPVLLLALAAGGCAWNPHMAPRTYQGIVYNEPLKRPEPFATVGASRSGAFIAPGLVQSEALGSTRADAHGRFSLTTRTGYAQTLSAGSPDGRMGGRISKSLAHNRNQVVIPIRSGLTGGRGEGSVDLEMRDQMRIWEAIDKILFHYAATGHAQRYSLTQYKAMGVISARDFESFMRKPELIFSPKPFLRYFWNNEEILFPSPTRKFVLKRAPNSRFPFELPEIPPKKEER